MNFTRGLMLIPLPYSLFSLLELDLHGTIFYKTHSMLEEASHTFYLQWNQGDDLIEITSSPHMTYMLALRVTPMPFLVTKLV
jgi:hypothetical protein